MRGNGPTSISQGAILTVCMRWTDRLIGFISTVILARLLAPADFGIIGMASLVVGMVDVLLALGVNVALIQNRNPLPDHYHTAWTLRLIQSAVAALVIFAAAPYAAIYFSDLRIVPVLHFMAAGMFLVGLENMGVVTFQKEMRFGLDFRFMFLKRIVGFFTTIVTAWILHSYWALVIGALAGRFFGVLLSYQMHAMRPRLSLGKIREIFSISQWMLVNNIGNYLSISLNKILVGHRSSAAILGGYSLADDISSMPTTELLAPLNRVLFPAFVRATHDLEELKKLFLLAQGVQSLLGIPAGIGLALVAHEAVLILLGEKWLFVAPFVQILACANVIESITTSGNYVLIAMGNPRNAALVGWIKVSLFLLTLFAFFPDAVALQIAWVRVVADLGGLVISVWMLTRTMRNISLLDILHSIQRPLLGTAAMAAAVISIDNLIYLPPLAALMVKIIVGAITYAAAVLLLWRIDGKQDGAESYIFGRAAEYYRNFKSKILRAKA